jgi:tartrate dehydrogenase/decarboxylase/D-malate dehydrogenase
VVEKVAADYADVTLTSYHVDALAVRFVMVPQTLDVVVASNLFGDILTDLGGALHGSLGLAASGNINPPAPTRACSSPSTARPPTSPVPGSPTSWRPCGPGR